MSAQAVDLVIGDVSTKESPKETMVYSEMRIFLMMAAVSLDIWEVT
jgi:hypothetical protein